MDGILLFGIIVCGAGQAVFSFWLSKEIKRVHKRIDALFTVDKPAENKVTEVDPNLVDLDEENMVVPKGVKLEVEGGDTTPPEYKEK